MQIDKVMIPLEKLITAQHDDSVFTGIQAMAQNGVGSIIIYDEKDEKAKGIVTSNDIMRILSDDRKSGFDKTMSDIMSTDLISINVKDQLDNVLKRMDSHQVHHLVVNDQQGKLAGIISSFDVVREKSLENEVHPWLRRF